MKKKLEAELISIAHRILKLKNKSELDQLYLETQKLYEKLAVLKFVEENFSDLQPTIGRTEAEDILATAFEEKESAETAEDKPKPEEDKDQEKEEEKIQEPTTPEEEKLASDATPNEQEVDEVVAEAEEIAEAPTEEPEAAPAMETDDTPVVEVGIDFQEPETKQEIAAAMPEVKQEDLFKPSFEWTFDNKTEETTEKRAENETQTSAVAFEDLLGEGYKDSVFVKPEDETAETDTPAEDNRVEPAFSEPKPNVIPITSREDKVPVFKMNPETALGDRMSKGITVGLNDRIAFVKNLFNNSNEDYNRVLSQLITFNSYAEAQDFIAHMVKPDYNNWDGKEEFEQRFMEVIEKKFS
ncbi:DUF4476 domain-containing protein [Flavobacterium longum]|uniref:hypothetical protein n=1 Tax=Flavobacterium longum TaxID=1299340 RepID=UPI0039EC94B7